MKSQFPPKQKQVNLFRRNAITRPRILLGESINMPSPNFKNCMRANVCCSILTLLPSITVYAQEPATIRQQPFPPAEIVKESGSPQDRPNPFPSADVGTPSFSDSRQSRSPINRFLPEELQKVVDSTKDYSSIPRTELAAVETKLRSARIATLKAAIEFLQQRLNLGIPYGVDSMQLFELQDQLAELELKSATSTQEKQKVIKRGIESSRKIELRLQQVLMNGTVGDASVYLIAVNHRLEWEERLVKELRASAPSPVVKSYPDVASPIVVQQPPVYYQTTPRYPTRRTYGR